MLKAAETTKAAGATHFAIVGAADASSTGSVVVPGQSRTSFVGNSAYTTYTPATAYNFIKPGQDTYIRVFTIPANQPTPNGLLSPMRSFSLLVAV